MKHGKSLKAGLISVFAAGISAATAAQAQSETPSQEKIFETNVTQDLNISSGEPQIAVDPTNPNRIAVAEFAVGSAEVPAFAYNAETSLAGSPGFDDYSHIALDGKYAHLIWGDRRLRPLVDNIPGGIGGVQAWYGRVPFSAMTKKRTLWPLSCSVMRLYQA